MTKEIYARKSKRLNILISSLKLVIKTIEEEINSIIESTEVLNRQMKLLTSIDGIGSVVAMNMIIITEAFTRFENSRQFCCYAGVAPFAYTSGTSQHSKCKVSQIAHRKGGDLRIYFDRKVGEGRDKMIVLNAVRTKLVARIFSVVKRNECYSPILS